MGNFAENLNLGNRVRPPHERLCTVATCIGSKLGPGFARVYVGYFEERLFNA